MRGREGLVYLAVCLVAYASAAGITTVYSMLSTLYREFPDTRHIGWVVSSYWVVGSVGAAIGGRLGDAFGRRRLSIVLLLIAAGGCLVSALAGTLDGIIVGCALQGATGALTPLSIGIVRETFPREKIPKAIGVVTAAGMTSAGLAFMMAGFFIDHYSWRGGFYMKIVIALLAVTGLLAFVPPSRPNRDSLNDVDLVKGMLFAPVIVGIFVALQLGRDLGWGNPWVLGLVSASLALIWYWVGTQRDAGRPLVDVRSLGRRPVLFGNLSIALLAMGGFQQGQIMSLMMQQPQWTGGGFGLSASMAGVLLMVLNAVSVVAGPRAGTWALKAGARRVAMSGATVMSAAWVAIAVYRPTLAWLVACDLVMLVGMSLLQAAAYVAIVQATQPARTSEATGMTYVLLNTFIAVGGQVVFLLLGTGHVADPAKGPGSFPSYDSYTLACGFVVGVSLLGIAAAAALPRHIGQPAA